MSEQIEQSIIGMYSLGMSTRDSEDQVREMYGAEISESTVSTGPGRVLDVIKEWQSSPLEPVYFTGWMDGIQFKVRHNGKVVSKCIYLVIG
jgi:putative transposase